MAYLYIYSWLKYDLGISTTYLKFNKTGGADSWPTDHDSTFHVTEMPL